MPSYLMKLVTGQIEVIIHCASAGHAAFTRYISTFNTFSTSLRQSETNVYTVYTRNNSYKCTNFLNINALKQSNATTVIN